MSQITQEELIKEYYLNHPKRDIPHREIVDWVTAEYKRRTGEVFRDPDRAIRKLSQQGFLIKEATGVYRYDPDHVEHRELEDFTAAQKQQILERDGYRCVVCGKGPMDGMTLHVDHIKPKDLGGKATLENGQILCATHNFRKKNYGQTETGKKMFIRLYELAKKSGDAQTMDFCAQILEIFEKNRINGHIIWKR